MTATSNSSANKSPVTVGFGVSNSKRRTKVTVASAAVAALALVTLAVFLSTASCGISCSKKCSDKSQAAACYTIPADTCTGEIDCAVTTGCYCAGMTNSTPEPKGCNIATCHYSDSEGECLQWSGCAWGDACRGATKCESLDESGCNEHFRRCEWMEDGCG